MVAQCTAPEAGQVCCVVRHCQDNEGGILVNVCESCGAGLLGLSGIKRL